MPVGLWRSQVRECDLLENGEMAMGKIARQWKDDKNNSSVEYEFSDYQGQTHKGMGFDYTGKLFEGMSCAGFLRPRQSRSGRLRIARRCTKS